MDTPPEVGIGEIDEHLPAVGVDAPSHRHGRRWILPPPRLDQRQGGGVPLHQHTRQRGGLLGATTARRDEPIGAGVGGRRLGEVRLIGRGDRGDIALQVGGQPQGREQRAGGRAVIVEIARPTESMIDSITSRRRWCTGPSLNRTT